MGSFNVACPLSKLVITEDTPVMLQFLIGTEGSNKTQTWSDSIVLKDPFFNALGAPIRAVYTDSGRFEIDMTDPVAPIMFDFLNSKVKKKYPCFQDLLDDVRNGDPGIVISLEELDSAGMMKRLDAKKAAREKGETNNDEVIVTRTQKYGLSMCAFHAQVYNSAVNFQASHGHWFTDGQTVAQTINDSIDAGIQAYRKADEMWKEMSQMDPHMLFIPRRQRSDFDFASYFKRTLESSRHDWYIPMLSKAVDTNTDLEPPREFIRRCIHHFFLMNSTHTLNMPNVYAGQTVNPVLKVVLEEALKHIQPDNYDETYPENDELEA